MEELLDVTTFDAMKELLEDEFPSFLEMFFAENQEALDNIGIGLECDNTAVIQSAAHNLKSSSGYIGAIKLSKLARDIETQSGTGSTASIAGMFAESQTIFKALKANLQ